MIGSLTRRTKLEKELFVELQVIEKQLMNLENRREEIYKRLDTISESNGE